MHHHTENESSLFSLLLSCLLLFRLLFSLCLCLLSLSSFSVSLCLSPCRVVVVLLWWVVVWCVVCVVYGVCPLNTSRVYVQNVPVCTGTMGTCVSTCARGAGMHGAFLKVHTGAF